MEVETADGSECLCEHINCVLNKNVDKALNSGTVLC